MVNPKLTGLPAPQPGANKPSALGPGDRGAPYAEDPGEDRDHAFLSRAIEAWE
jgi:hypothetical protein